MIDPAHWAQLRHTARAVFASSLHFSVASVGDDGVPLVTPIGSLLLEEPGHAVYFELFATGLGERLDADPRFSLLGVDSARLLWLDALLRSRFRRSAGVRMIGRAGASRAATQREQDRWRRRVRWVWPLQGSRRLWGRLDRVRDLWIDRVDPVRLGPLDPLG